MNFNIPNARQPIAGNQPLNDVWYRFLEQLMVRSKQSAEETDLTAHIAAADPHPVYLTQAEGDALYALSVDLSGHISQATGAHAASAISFSPAGGIAANDVQAAILEARADSIQRANHTGTQTASTISDFASAVDAQTATNRQPLDADLTALAALTTTTFGRNFNELANAAAARAKILTLEGTYTPTLTAVTNVSAMTTAVCTWLRVGNSVTVSGVITVDPTAVGVIAWRMSLPVSSNFTNINQCGGVASSFDYAGSYGAFADAANDQASFRGVASDATNQFVSFHFTYQVL